MTHHQENESVKHMNRRIKIGSTVAAGLLIISAVAGCSSTSTGTAAGTSGKIGKIVYIPGLTGNPFYSTVSCGAS